MEFNRKLLDQIIESNGQLFKIKNFDANQIIYNENDICETVDFILQGTVAISTLSYSGKEEYFNNLKENEAFGNVLLFTNDHRYLGDVIAKSPNTIIASINKANLLKIFGCNQDFAENYLSLICNEALESKKEKKLLLHKKISDRIIYLLQQHNGRLQIESITELAHYLSYPRPSMSRTINKMIDEGIITYKDKILALKM